MANNFSKDINVPNSTATPSYVRLDNASIKHLYTKKLTPGAGRKHIVTMCALTCNGDSGVISEVIYHHPSSSLFTVSISKAGVGIYDFYTNYSYSPQYVMPMATLLDDGGWNKRCISIQNYQETSSRWRTRVILTDTGNNARVNGWFSLVFNVLYGVTG